MNEHEIFNSDEDDVLVETKSQRTKNVNNFWRNLFSFEMLPVFLSVSAMFLSLFTYLMPVIGARVGAIVFFVLAFVTALSALVISLIPMIRDKKLTINPQVILSLAAILVSLPALF